MEQTDSKQKNDFSQGSVSGNILRLALPMTFAQLINVLYSVIDRMYIGHIPDAAANALTGIGLIRYWRSTSFLNRTGKKR